MKAVPGCEVSGDGFLWWSEKESCVIMDIYLNEKETIGGGIANRIIHFIEQ